MATLSHAASLVAVVICVTLAQRVAAYEPNWKSIDSRPLPPWFDEAKIGIFLHWGVYSVPSWGTTGGAAGEWYWWRLDGEKNPAYVDFHEKTYGKNFKYQDFAPQFHAELFNATAWAELFADAGAKYVVLTSKHHEGFTNWPSAESWNWNSVDNGPHMDLVGNLSQAVRKAGLVWGNYFSLFEWFHPLYLQDKANNFTTSLYVDEVMIPQLKDLVTRYKPDVIWADGDWEANSTYWKSTEFLAWLYNEAPNKNTVCVNDRWGSDCSLKHGGYYSGSDRFSPGKLLSHKWEDAFTVDSTTWGYKRNSDIGDYLTVQEMVSTVVQTVAFGGNALINVGPTHDGRIAAVFQERLLGLGNYLKVNGEAIYKSKPWTKAQNQTDINAFYTTQGDTLYCLITPWPHNSSLVLRAPDCSSKGAQITLLGTSGDLTFSQTSDGVRVTIPSFVDGAGADPNGPVLKLSGCK